MEFQLPKANKKTFNDAVVADEGGQRDYVTSSYTSKFKNIN